ncbi:AAA family ATPase [Acinetobacter baumannii]|uniref:McrB family protein n=2 Tax=Acinetobacter baumannii TaxID=470 RepID=UPI0002BA8643|nr:AAA family ATPase [Acinetobacter baumannii]EJB8467931.1 AAA family ATPase [Acinetobacter baumannii]MCJ9179771.1 AAA family ATPase [Acinetobacter baumannii]MCJ9183614.1 AAA family ATPase [Acinetobacter baumannii]MCJ9190911.1 AAA family ATPase [Acinetobacter baumannii]MCJ9198270.1 AAA family ATPase [Acinetobacter baumannii]
MYLSKKLIQLSIDSLESVESTGTANGHADLFAFFLILKLQNLKINHWSHNSEIYDRDKILTAIYLLGGLASPEEKPGKKSCLFFTGFKNKKLYNEGTTFNGLPSRLVDTIDNSAADHLLDKNQKDIKFKRVVVDNLTKKYPSKFNIYALIYWIYRGYNFEKEFNKFELKDIFCHQFNFSNQELEKIFDMKPFYEPEYSTEMMSYADIREYIGITDIELNSTRLNIEISDLNLEKYAKELRMINHELKVDSNLILEVLDKYKQVILTGVPGVGKSYFINKLRGDFDITFIQFHQNYSYQDFIVGKTINNGSVSSVEGDLIKAIEKARSNSDKKILLVLDEINRGNISSIFGELMYLLDRGNNSIYIEHLNKQINLPDNLYILGTMNSADRSIAVIDYALRRRFPFITILPDYDLINQSVILKDEENEYRNLGSFLFKINENIKKYFNNKDLQLGHAYFMKNLSIKDKEGEIYILSSKDIFFILFFEIIPMLVEYNNGDDSHLNDIFSEEILSSKKENLIKNIVDFVDN